MSTTAKTINWKTTRAEVSLIRRICKRGIEMARTMGVDYEPMTMHMDIAATHANGCPLDLAKFANAPDLDFGHDLFGIRRHIDRETGELRDFFVPRCAKQ